MTDEVIRYFKNNLSKKLKRPRCGRFLSLWDEKIWVNRVNNIHLDYVKSNNFLLFLYQTKHELCCVEDINAQNLNNAVDKMFYLIFEHERYYSMFIFNKLYNNRLEIIDDVSYFYRFNTFPSKIQKQYRYIELFKDLIKKIDEWAYWKRIAVISFTKIILTDFSYEYAQKVAPAELQNLINNVEKVLNKGINN